MLDSFYFCLGLKGDKYLYSRPQNIHENLFRIHFRFRSVGMNPESFCVNRWLFDDTRPEEVPSSPGNRQGNSLEIFPSSTIIVPCGYFELILLEIWEVFATISFNSIITKRLLDPELILRINFENKNNGTHLATVGRKVSWDVGSHKTKDANTSIPSCTCT